MSELQPCESESSSEPEPEPEPGPPGLYLLPEAKPALATEIVQNYEVSQQAIAAIVELIRYRVALNSSEKNTSLFRREAVLSDSFGIIRLSEYAFSHPNPRMEAVSKAFFEEELANHVAGIGVYSLTESESAGWVETLEDNYLIKSTESDELTIGTLWRDPESGEDVYTEVDETEAVRLLEVLRSLSVPPQPPFWSGHLTNP